MREVRNWGEYLGGMTQLHIYCRLGMTSSVMRILEMKSIDVEARQGHEVNGDTCLISVAWKGHLDICRLLIDKGADIEKRVDDLFLALTQEQ
jgi:hypothetical protein